MAHHSLSKSLKIAGGIGLGAAILVVVAGRYFAPAFGVLSFLWLPVAIAIAIGAAIWILPAERLEQLLAKGLVRGLLIGLGLAAFYGVFGWLIYSNLPKLETFWNLSLLETGFLLVAITLVLVPVPAVIIGLFKATGIPIDPVNIGKWSRRVGIVILAILLVSGLSREGWREKWVRPAAAAVRPSVETKVYLPSSIWPVQGSRPCKQDNTTPIPINSVVQPVSVTQNGVGSYSLFWTGERSYRLLDNYVWPSGVREVFVEVRFIKGHLDQDNFWNPKTGNHLISEVTRGRNYRAGGNSLGYCPNRPISDYPCYGMGACSFLGPNQVWVGVDPSRPDRGIYLFSIESARMRVQAGDSPVLSFNGPSTASGRMHRAEFAVSITPIVP